MTQALVPTGSNLATQRYFPRFDSAPLSNPALFVDPHRRQKAKWKEVVAAIASWSNQREPAFGPVDMGACRLAILYARLQAEDGEKLPTRIGPTANGGVAFEWQDATSLIHIEVLDATNAEYTEFRGDDLVGDSALAWDEDDQTFYAIDS